MATAVIWRRTHRVIGVAGPAGTGSRTTCR
nr:MAG TPA: Guanylate kinase [Caudoviricetes sp.]